MCNSNPVCNSSNILGSTSCSALRCNLLSSSQQNCEQEPQCTWISGKCQLSCAGRNEFKNAATTPQCNSSMSNGQVLCKKTGTDCVTDLPKCANYTKWGADGKRWCRSSGLCIWNRDVDACVASCSVHNEKDCSNKSKLENPIGDISSYCEYKEGSCEPVCGAFTTPIDCAYQGAACEWYNGACQKKCSKNPNVTSCEAAGCIFYNSSGTGFYQGCIAPVSGAHGSSNVAGFGGKRVECLVNSYSSWSPSGCKCERQCNLQGSSDGSDTSCHQSADFGIVTFKGWYQDRPICLHGLGGGYVALIVLVLLAVIVGAGFLYWRSKKQNSGNQGGAAYQEGSYGNTA